MPTEDIARGKQAVEEETKKFLPGNICIPSESDIHYAKYCTFAYITVAVTVRKCMSLCCLVTLIVRLTFNSCHYNHSDSGCLSGLSPFFKWCWLRFKQFMIVVQPETSEREVFVSIWVTLPTRARYLDGNEIRLSERYEDSCSALSSGLLSSSENQDTKDLGWVNVGFIWLAWSRNIMR